MPHRLDVWLIVFFRRVLSFSLVDLGLAEAGAPTPGNRLRRRPCIAGFWRGVALEDEHHVILRFVDCVPVAIALFGDLVDRLLELIQARIADFEESIFEWHRLPSGGRGKQPG